MKNRLATFAVAILILPPLALSLSGQEWEAPVPIAGALWLPALLSTLAVLAFALLLDTLTFRRTGHSLLRLQRSYLLWSGVAGALACLLLAFLNLFANTWFTPAASATAALLVAALCGGALLPAVMVTRLWLAGLPGLARLGTRRLALPAVSAETAAKLLLLVALGGLLGPPLLAHRLPLLFWSSPLLLLAALQLLWNESTVFSGLSQGDWSRVLLSAVSGIVVGGIALASYRLSGGAIYLAAGTWLLLAQLALFGLFCIQLSDIVAEYWRGKPRSEVFKRKSFPIPIVTKKDQ